MTDLASVIAIAAGSSIGILVPWISGLYGRISDLKRSDERWKSRHNELQRYVQSLEHYLDRTSGPPHIDDKTRSLVRLAARSTNPSEAANAAIAACKRLDKA